ncbi:hypothetical protein PENSPDRAFT_683530 [Peniophora sp. CONT]|nr:hypothetical protein PENSPDRAFT_683530 [Peniophora sp. CONT]
MDEELSLGMLTAKDHLIATFLATLFLGSNVVLCFICVQILVNRHRDGVPSASRLLCATLLHLCLCIGHSAAFFGAALQGLVYHAAEPYGAATYFNGHWAGGWKTAQIAFFAGNDACYNAILVWRIHVVMSSDWRFTVPAIAMATGAAVGGFGSAIRAAMLPYETGLTDFFKVLAPWLTSFTATSAAMQILSSLLISWKVWAVVVRDTDSKPRSCSLVGAECASLRIIIESGISRALCGILLVPFAWGDSMGAVIVAAVACQIDATASYLIIIRTESLRTGDSRRPTTNFLSDVAFDSIQMTDVGSFN